MLVFPIVLRSIVENTLIPVLVFFNLMLNSCDSHFKKDQVDIGEIVVDDIYPDSGEVGTLLTISGKGFKHRGWTPSLVIGGQTISPSDITDKEVSYAIPETLQKGEKELKLKIDEEKIILSRRFKVIEFDEGYIGGDSVVTFNYRIGTQTFDPQYGFSEETGLVETAREVIRMGSNILKISLNPDKYNISTSITAEEPAKLLSEEPSFQEVMRMPFAYYFFWVGSHAAWRDGYTAEEREQDSVMVSELAEHLLKKYDGTGKQFFIGHWEGDWYLLPEYDTDYKPTELSIRGMIDYYNSRQNAIELARENYPDSDVEVFQYAEVNRVLDAMEGKDRLTNRVLPFSNVDYVSYSAYDVQLMNESGVHEVLDYIEGHMPEKLGIEGKRVFIGEYGRPAQAFSYSKLRHQEVNRKILNQFLTWGVPFVLYWEMYNNEMADKEQIGFWLIDDKGIEWPFYYTLKHLILSGKSWVNQFQIDKNRIPTQEEYNNWLIGITE